MECKGKDFIITNKIFQNVSDSGYKNNLNTYGNDTYEAEFPKKHRVFLTLRPTITLVFLSYNIK
jgi:hypothetical protein